jgi:enoyl-CoA hydratase
MGPSASNRTVEIDREGAVAVIRLNRPPANAIDLDFARELEATFARTTGCEDVRALVVTGSGGCFSAGLDLKRVPLYGRDQQRQMVEAVNRMILKLYTCPIPVVAAVNGHAIAGGLVLALACDYRIGTSAAAKIGLTEARAGIPFPAAAMAVVQAELNPAAARLMTLQSSNVGPQEALKLGVVDVLQPPERVMLVALAMAEDLASIPKDAYARIKRQLRGKTVAEIEAVLSRGDPLLDSWLTDEASTASANLLRR